MNLSLHQMKTFREVMRSGSISQAARTMGRTQPAVSTLIAKLEDQLGFALFIREHGKLTPTPEARYFLEEADAILARLDRTRQTLKRVGALEIGKLRIACYPAASGFFMPRLLTEFLRDKTDVEVSLIMRSSAVVEDLIASQQFDIGFAETPQSRTSVAQTDFDLECVCILPADDPLALRSVITPDDLDGRPMAVLFDEHPTALQTEAAFLSAKCRFNKRLELRTFLPGLHFVSQGFCYMICDMITAHSQLAHTVSSGLTIRRFRPRISTGVSILTPAYVSQALIAQSFAAYIAQAIHNVETEIDGYLNGPAGHTWRVDS